MCAVIVIVYLLNTFMFPSLWNTSQHKLSWNEDEDFQFWKSQAPPMANGQLETMIFGLSVNDWSLSSLSGVARWPVGLTGMLDNAPASV